MTPLRRAAILAVGSELLTASRLDTNSLFITDQVNRLGIDVVFKGVVGDDREELAAVFRMVLPRADLIVFTGGLGPTDDDVTREVVATVLNRTMSEDVTIVDQMRARFAARGLRVPMPENNRRQAMVPAGAQVIENTRGSAPGLWIDEDGRVVLLLPGPPRELEPMLRALLDGPLKARAAGGALMRRVIRIAGRIESETDQVLQPLYREWSAASPPISATILAALGQIELHLSTRTSLEAEADAALDAAVERVRASLGADVFSVGGETLEEVLGTLLTERGLKIAVAESCTGGLITSRLTDVSGSSRYVEQSIVTYANSAKIAMLGVPAALIDAHGAVSEPVARAMAEGIRARGAADVGVGVTGIAGPTGGSAEKPTGTVAIAAATPEGTQSRVFRFFGERKQVKFQASQSALDMVRRVLLGVPISSTWATLAKKS